MGRVTAQTPAAPRHARERGWLSLAAVDRLPLWRWLGPTLVTLLAAALRFPGAGHPHTLVFDETYYVKDAWSLWHLGYEGTWPMGSDPRFVAGHVNVFTHDGEFVAHPPLGKWLIGLGMHLAGGAESSFAWRFAAGVASTLTVLLLILVARRLLRSNVLGCLAGALLAIDGLSIVMGRTALLDVFIAPLVLVAFWALLIDRDRHAAWLEAHPGGWVHWHRPWLLLAGVSLGAATGVKWSGVWFLAFFGLYTVAADWRRRRAGDEHRADDGRALVAGQALVQGAWNAAVMVIPAAIAYLATWTGWLVTRGGFDRDYALPGAGPIQRAFAGLLDYHRQMYQFSATLTTPHDWASNPLMWPALWRPTLFYRVLDANGHHGCHAGGGCITTISAIPNPLLWWGSQIAVGILVYWLIRRRDRTAGLILLGVAAGWLPWFLYFRRTMFMFYAVAWQPFYVMALVLVIKRFLSPASPGTPGRRMRPSPRQRTVIVAVGLVLVLLVSVFFWPLWTGIRLPYLNWAAHSWFPWSWH